jgi:pantetheine-phosphate adenylyltransferase
MAKKYNIVGLGGTFDHFHQGHKHFLQFAARWGRTLHVGVTHPKLTLYKPYAYLIEEPEKRVRAVKKYCKEEHIQCATFELNDVYGTTLIDERIEALIVTAETVAGARTINDTRLKMGMTELPIHLAPLFLNTGGEALHSEQIRAGEANREGEVYSKLFEEDLKITNAQREFFQEPLGNIVTKPELTTVSPICVVGDYSLENFVKNNWTWNIGVFDHKQQRQTYTSPTLEELDIEYQAKNKAGLISTNLVTTLQKMIGDEEKKKVLLVHGEEDLAAVALVLLLPLDSLVYYGQPNRGMVELVVTEQLKEKVFSILK